MNGDNIKAPEKIGPEIARLYFLFKVFVRCSKNPDINLDVLIAADTLKGLFLKNPQDLCLGFHAHVADFIKKEHTAVSLVKFATFACLGTGERAFFMTEKFTFN